MPLTIFISHSTKKDQHDSDELVTSDHRPFLDDLCDRLNFFEDPDGAKPFEVLVDSDLLKVGDPWRKKLIDGLGTCGAGIVLLNKKAITKSDWVLAEANILRWRDWREEDFLLVLVALGEGSRAAFKAEAKWRPLAFSEVQFLDGGSEHTGRAMPAASFDLLTARLPRVEEDRPQTRFEKLELAVRLELEEALRGDAKQRAREEARNLMEQGPAGLDDLVQRLGNYLDPDRWLQVVEAIACWWIDPGSACHLAKAANPAIQQNSFSLTGKKILYTPRLYARHAAFLPPRFSWKVADRITASGGQQQAAVFHEKVVNEVRKNLIKIYRNAWDDPDDVGDNDIKKLIRDYLEREPPVPTFVTLPDHIAADVAVKEAILEVFPGLAFLHFTGDPAAARAIPNCQPLEPLPRLEEEIKAHGDYTTARGRLSP